MGITTSERHYKRDAGTGKQELLPANTKVLSKTKPRYDLSDEGKKNFNVLKDGFLVVQKVICHIFGSVVNVILILYSHANKYPISVGILDFRIHADQWSCDLHVTLLLGSQEHGHNGESDSEQIEHLRVVTVVLILRSLHRTVLDEVDDVEHQTNNQGNDCHKEQQLSQIQTLVSHLDSLFL